MFVDFFCHNVEEPGESDDDRQVLPRAIHSSALGVIEDENENRKQPITKKKRKRFVIKQKHKTKESIYKCFL